MVSFDFRDKRHHNIKWEDPICFDGIHTYQLVIKSRGLDSLASNQNCFRNCKIIRIKLDGSTETIKNSKKYPIESIPGFEYRKFTATHLRFDGVIKNDDIDLLQILNEIKFLHPVTLYIIEMDIKTDTGMILKFASRQMKMRVVLERIEKSKNTLESPLVLKNIYDIETLREVRKKYLGRKMSFILVGEKAAKKVMVYKVLENGDDDDR